MLAPSPAGRTVLRLVLDHLRPPLARPIGTSAVRGARAEKEAHAQQILHDRRQRRAIQEDIAKLSSREEIDRREVAPRIPLSGSTWTDVDLRGAPPKWGGESWVPGKGSMKRYEDRRESQAGKRGLRAVSIRRMEEKGCKKSEKGARARQGQGQHRQYSIQHSLDQSTGTEAGPNRRARRAHLREEYEKRAASSATQWRDDVEDPDEELQQGRMTRTNGDPDEIPDSNITDLEDDSPSLSHGGDQEKTASLESILRGSLNAGDIKIEDVEPLRPMKIAQLASTFCRTLFSPGVHPMQDQRTGVWNFPHLYQAIPQPEEFAFDRVPGYIRPSEDNELPILAKREKCRFVGSTSTLTKALSHIYFAISGKGVDLTSFTQEFASERSDFTAGAELPAALILTRGEDGVVSVDSDKSFDVENVLSDFGRILEKLLTTHPSEFQGFLTKNPETPAVKAQKEEKEAYKYRKSGSLLMRSQLDCHDSRLPGSGVFDIKTRAVFPIRHDRANYEVPPSLPPVGWSDKQANSAYFISERLGLSGSFEKELYDLLRAAMLKFSMQVRIGDMDGIFLAYHNTKLLLGFQYLPLEEMDRMIFGSTEMGDSAFRLSVGLLEKVLQQISEEQSANRMEVVMRQWGRDKVHIFVTPVSSSASNGSADGQGERRKKTMYSLQVRSTLNGREVNGPIEWPMDAETPPEWKVSYTLSRSSSDPASALDAAAGLSKALKMITGMNTLAVPDGKSVEEMRERDRALRMVEVMNRLASTSTSSYSSPTSATGTSSPLCPTTPQSSAISTEEEEQAINDAPGGQVKSRGAGPGAGSPRIRWRDPDDRILKIRKEAQDSGKAYEERKKKWKRMKNDSGWKPLEK